MGIDYVRFDRVLSRAEELVQRPDVDVSVKRVYEDKLAPVAVAFRAGHSGLKNAEVMAKKERSEGLAALEQIDQPYRKTRVVAQQYVKDLAFPKTLKSLPTETDKRDAVRGMLEIIDLHDDEPGWAADLSAGEFGRLAPEAIREISEWIEANGNLEKAVRARMDAYNAAYEPFLRFREVVRTVYSPSSVHYRRLLVRSNGKLAVEDPVDVDPESDPTPGG